MTAFMPGTTENGKHPIGVPLGDAGDVEERGQQIVDLGADMANAWSLISRLVDDGADMEGDAVDKLREVAGEVNSDLKDAGELYTAVGPHIRTYGQKLGTAQTNIRPIVEDLVRLWGEYDTLLTDAAFKTSMLPAEPGADADQDEKDAYRRADQAASDLEQDARDKHTEWVEKGDEYDLAWNSWHEAFETASTNIKEGISGSIEDSWKDNVRGALDFLGDVLAVAGIVLAVLAIVVGGPIIGALAAIVAVASLVVAIAKFGVGDGNWLDLTFAIIGVVPFIGQGAKFFRAAGEAGGVWAATKSAFSADAARLFNPAGGFSSWMSRVNALSGNGFGQGALKFTTEFLTGKGIDDWAEMGSSGLNALDTVSSVWSAQFGIVGAIKDTATGAWQRTFDPNQNPFAGPMTAWS